MWNTYTQCVLRIYTPHIVELCVLFKSSYCNLSVDSKWSPWQLCSYTSLLANIFCALHCYLYSGLITDGLLLCHHCPYNQTIWQYTYTLPTHILELKLCNYIVLLIQALVCLWGFAQPPESPSVPLWSLVSGLWSQVPLTQAQTSWDTEPDFNTLKEMDTEVETYKQYAIK